MVGEGGNLPVELLLILSFEQSKSLKRTYLDGPLPSYLRYLGRHFWISSLTRKPRSRVQNLNEEQRAEEK